MKNPAYICDECVQTGTCEKYCQGMRFIHNQKYGLRELIEAVDYYQEKNGQEKSIPQTKEEEVEKEQIQRAENADHQRFENKKRNHVIGDA